MLQSPRKYFVLLMTASLLFSSPSYSEIPAVDSCKIVPLNDARVLGRAATVRFRNGREITVVGHHHGYRQIFGVYLMAISGQLSEMSDVQFIAFLKKIQKDNTLQLPSYVTQQGRTLLLEQAWQKQKVDLSALINPSLGFDIGPSSVREHAVNDYNFLADLVTGKMRLAPIQFVGNEALDEERQLMAEQILEALQALQHQAQKRSEIVEANFSFEELRDIYISAMNGHNYLYATQPQMMSNIPNVGVESLEAIKAYNAENPLSKIDLAWEKLLDADRKYWASLPEAARAQRTDQVFVQSWQYQSALMDDVYMMVLEDEADLERRIQIIRPWVPVWVRKESEELFEAYRRRFAANLYRDRAAINNMLNRDENGVHFVGQNHLKMRLKILVDRCLQE